MPLKTELLKLPGAWLDDSARLVGAANTVILDGAEGHGLAVWNTDAPGLANALTRYRPGLRLVEATIVGSGATARSALVGLSALGTQRVHVVARSSERARALQPLADGLGIALTAYRLADPPPPTELVVSCVPGGVLTAAIARRVVNAPVVFDLSYHPWPSELARAAAAAGAEVLDGIELLADQAALQLRLMTGSGVPPGVLVAAARAELAGRAQFAAPGDGVRN